MHHHRFLLLHVGLVCCLLLTSFTTAQASAVAGRVTSVTDGHALAGAKVTLGSASTLADSNGNYTFSNVAAGAYTLTGSASGYLSRSYSISVVAGSTLTQNIQLSVAGILSGTVTNTSGTGIAGATVQYSGGVLSQTKSISTDTSGHFNTGWIPVGTYTVTASATGYQSNNTTATVYTGKTTTVSIQLTSGSGTGTGTVTGKVTSVTTGSAISGATLTLGSASTTSDSSGNYSFANVAASSYTLTAKASGYLSGSYTISVPAGATTTQNVQLSVAGKIAGTVASSGGSVIAGATVQVIGGVLNQTFTSTTNSTGAYNTGWIPIGNYNVTASASGSASNPATATVNTGQTTTLNITVSSGTATGVTISPTRTVVTFATTQQFTSNASVSWSVDGVTGGNSTVGTISTSGLYTPPQAVGQHTVTAAGQADSSQTASATVWVSNSGPVLTHKYDNYRTGQNMNETVLTPSNVNSSTFGKLFSYPVDGFTYAQPLYVPNLSIAGGTHNVVFVATEHDSVYAFDADGKRSTPYWKVSFLSSGVTTFPQSSGSDLGLEVGITSTPVIDLSTGTMYVVADTQVNGSGARYQLHALDITTGAEKFAGPVTISGSVSGTGAGSSGGVVTFNPVRHMQRPALLLANGAVYIAFGSYGDIDPYHGWVFAYSASTLAPLGVFCDTPNGSEGGIWMAGGGLAADGSGNVYVATGNGSFSVQNGGRDYGDSIVAFSSSTGLSVADWFSPYNNAFLDNNDLDLGSGGPLLLPDGTGGANLLVLGGKNGALYVVNRGSLGHWQSSSDSQIVQSIQNASPGEFFNTPAYWNGWVYFGGQNDHIRTYQLQNGILAAGSVTSATFSRGPAPAITSNGTSNAILWALQPNGDISMVLHAWDATDLTRELYNSTQAGSRDDAGAGNKFVAPAVADGKVFVGTKKTLAVYGLLPQ